jgi:D-glycero-D-manno-heptose 1,7-bisphosphate phosphatase
VRPDANDTHPALSEAQPGGGPALSEAQPSRRAVFLDRDGTVLEEAGYLDRLERLVFFPFAIDAIRLLNRAGFAVVIITNQSGVGRGMYEEDFVHQAHGVVDQRVTAGGGHIDGFYYCPHHPTAEIERYRKDCDCRKPGPGMLHAAAEDLELDLSRSFAVGDKWTDVQAGNTAGAKGILVRTGYGRSSEASSRRHVEPAWIADDLIAATAWILRQG